MIAYPRDHEHSAEAGLKYLILAGVCSALLVFGMASICAGRNVGISLIAASVYKAQGGSTDFYWLTGLALINQLRHQRPHVVRTLCVSQSRNRSERCNEHRRR